MSPTDPRDTLVFAWLAVLCVFTGYVLLHIAGTRLFGIKRQFGFHVALLGAGALAVVALMNGAGEPLSRLAAFIGPVPGLETATTVLLLIGGYGVFLDFYCVVNTSVRLRICADIHGKRGEPSTRASIAQGYGSEKASGERYERLVSGGYATIREQRVSLTPKGTRLGRFMHAVRSLYRA